jgi:hypothetical protein
LTTNVVNCKQQEEGEKKMGAGTARPRPGLQQNPAGGPPPVVGGPQTPPQPGIFIFFFSKFTKFNKFLKFFPYSCMISAYLTIFFSKNY